MKTKSLFQCVDKMNNGVQTKHNAQFGLQTKTSILLHAMQLTLVVRQQSKQCPDPCCGKMPQINFISVTRNNSGI